MIGDINRNLGDPTVMENILQSIIPALMKSINLTDDDIINPVLVQ